MTKLTLFPTFGRTVKKSLVELYTSMGFSFLLSALWFIGFLPILLMLGLLIAAGETQRELFSFLIIDLLGISFWNGLVSGPLTTALYGLYQVRKTDYPSIKAFWLVLKKVYWRSAGLHWVFSLAATVLIFNIIMALSSFKNYTLLIPGVLSVYILFLVALAFYYFHPLLYLGNSFKKVVKKSFLLVLDNMGLSLFFALFFGIIFLISAVLVFPLFVLYGALVVYITDNGFEAIYQKYD